MKDKIKQLFIVFSEVFDVSSFFCITINYYKNSQNYLVLSAIADYTYELDMYLIEKDFTYNYDITNNSYIYKKGNLRITLINKYK